MESQGIEKQLIVEVDGVSYKVHMFAPSRAIRLAVQLSKIVGEPIAAMAASDKMGFEKALPVAARALISSLDETNVMNLIKSLLDSVSVDNRPINMDIDFKGRLGQLVQLISKVIEVQFKDFFNGLAGMSLGAKGKEAEAEKASA